jgi:cytochrome c oxidase subunit IV
MKVTTKSTNLPTEARPGKPSRRALLAYYGVGLTLGLIVAIVARMVWDRSTMVIAGFVFTAAYVLVALPILFWGASRPAD